ncbi:uncharacterized protein G2W53_010390 [Senna tora]|uniref:Uncharacterized protein n=1 Tax=Senna tora TaxID=362788 RepID=A0A835CBB1_9FABA|nr:uncharacterized protein G2W53_010390 [Senna tora]
MIRRFIYDFNAILILPDRNITFDKLDFHAHVIEGVSLSPAVVVPAATPRMGSFSLSLSDSLPLLQCFRYKDRAGIDVRTVIRTSDHPYALVRVGGLLWLF